MTARPESKTPSRRRVPRLKGPSINRMIPNVLTLLALCAGLTSVRFGLQERWEAAVLAILLAGVLDGLDGRIARLLNGTSKFGAELDSLSDFVSFGVAPALLLYFWTMYDAGGMGWAFVLLFAICAALRLARFNTQQAGAESRDLPVYAYNFFTGVPAPAAAALVLLPMMLSFEFGTDIFGSDILNGLFLLGVALLMVSRLPTFSAKKIRVPQGWVLPILIVVGLLAAFMVTEPWLTFGGLGLAYLAAIPLAWYSFRKLKAAAEELQGDTPTEGSGSDDDTDAGDPPPDDPDQAQQQPS